MRLKCDRHPDRGRGRQHPLGGRARRRFLCPECGGAGRVLAYRIGDDGSMTLFQTVTGLPIPF